MSEQPTESAESLQAAQLEQLVQGLGFIETDELIALKTRIAEFAIAGTEAEVKEAILAYEDEAMKLVDVKQGVEYTSAQLGLSVAMALTWKSVGRSDMYKEGIDNALWLASQQGFAEAAGNLREVLKQLESQAAAAEVTPPEPTSQELASALEDVLTPEDREEIASMDMAEGLGYAFSLLLEQGIEDPEAYLRDKGILE